MSLKGQLLISAPELQNDHFAWSVVLIAAHSKTGAFGFIINHQTAAPLKETWASFSDAPCLRDELLYAGGPLSRYFAAIHRDPSLANVKVTSEIFIAAEVEVMGKLVAKPDKQAIFVMGSAGWDAGQLEAEIQAGAWLTLPATVERVFADPATMWEKLLAEKREKEFYRSLNIEDFPGDLSVN